MTSFGAVRFPAETTPTQPVLSWDNPNDLDALRRQSSLYQDLLNKNARTYGFEGPQSAENYVLDLMRTGKAYNAQDPSLKFTGVTRQGQELYADLGDQLERYFLDPTSQESLKAGALDRALQGGIDLGKIGDDRYLTGKFQSWDEYVTQAPTLTKQFQTYASDPTKYTFLDPTKTTQYSKLPGFENIAPIADLSPLGYSVYETPAISDLFGKYSFIDRTKLGEDVFARELLGRGVDLGDQLALSKDDLTYYSNLANAIKDSKIGYYGMEDFLDPYKTVEYGNSWWTGDRSQKLPVHNLKIDGQTYVYTPLEVLSEMGYNPSGGAGFSSLTGYDPLFKGMVASIDPSIIPTDTVNVDWRYDNPGIGYVIPEADWQKYYGGDYSNPTLNPGDWANFSGSTGSQFVGQNLIRATPELKAQLAGQYAGFEDRGGLSTRNQHIQDAEWIIPDPSNPNAVMTVDKDGNIGHIDTVNTWVEQRGGGGLFGSIGRAISPIVPILSAVVPGFGAGYGLVSGLQSGNIGQILSGALGAANIAGLNPIGGVTGAIGDALANVPGLEFLNSSFVGPLTGVEQAVQQGLGGAVTGGISSAITGGDIGSGIISGGLGGAAGSFAGDLDLGGSGSFFDKLAPSVASNLTKDLVLTGGKNFDDILKNTGYLAAGNIAGNEVFKQLAVKPEVTTEGVKFVSGDTGDTFVFDKEGNPLGFKDKNGDFMSYSEVATKNGEKYQYGPMDYLDNKNARKYSEAAATGVSELLKTGSIESALMAALPAAAGGAIDQLFDTIGIDTRLDEGAIAKALVGYGVKQERAKDLASAAKDARTGAYKQAVRSQGVSEKDADRVAAMDKPERDAEIARLKAERKRKAKNLMRASRTSSEPQAEPRGAISAAQQVLPPMDGVAPGEPNLDPALARALAELEAMGVEYAEV